MRRPAGNGRRLDYRDREKRKKQIYNAKTFSAWDGVDMNSTMIRQYTDQNVYEAFLDRMHFIFSEFDNIFVSFPGGKDSGLLLNMLLDFRRKYYPHRRIGVFHQDFEAQYTVTTQYVEKYVCPVGGGSPDRSVLGLSADGDAHLFQ